MEDKLSLELAKKIVDALKEDLDIGRFSRFCDEPADFDSATDEELIQLISNVLKGS